MNNTYYDQISEGYEELHREEQEKKLKIIKENLQMMKFVGKTNFGTLKMLKHFGVRKALLFWMPKTADRPFFSIKKGESILDVGCGTGITSNFLEFTENITGLDPSKKLLEKCSLPIKKVLAEAEDIPFKDSTFDIVSSVTAIQNFHDIEKGLKEIARVGKNRFILTFLKKSPKKENIIKLINKYFKVNKKIEEEKDIMFFCEKR